ncbi:MAG: IPT/TIG domain-containing protein [Kiritimatiellae bacterium]|nr:IPT/TIG domain-containing protein [Kiritimatiellia bacterium]
MSLSSARHWLTLGVWLQLCFAACAGTIGGTNLDWTSWQEVAGLPAARDSLAAAVLHDKLYAIGGREGGIIKANVYRFDGTTATTWTAVANLPAARDCLAAGTLHDALYAIGGKDGVVSAKANVYCFNETNWTAVASLPAARYYQVAGMLNGRLYAVGGYNSGAKTNVYCFDGTNWTEVASLPAAQASAAAGILNGALYVVGGYDSSGALTNAYCFDGTNWTEVASLPAARSGLAAEVLNGALYVFGGTDTNGDVQANGYCFDGTNWTETVALPAARQILAAGVLNGILYAVGGRGVSSATNVYRYPKVLNIYSGVLPSSGSWTGGYQVVITGTNLCNGSEDDLTNVTLRGVSATLESVAGSTQIVVVAGAGSPGLGNVQVYSTSAGESAASNVFTYLASIPILLGTNGAAIASGEAASAAKGTDFGSISWGTALTNTFSSTNAGDAAMTISGITTNGVGAEAFSIVGLGYPISVGGVSNFNIIFAPSLGGVNTAAVCIANNSYTNSTYVLYLAGTVPKQDQTITNFTPTNGSIFATTSTVGLVAQASSGLPVTNFTVGSGPGAISGLTNLSFTGSGWVSIVASQAGNANWNTAPNVTNTFNVLSGPTPTENGWLAVQVTPADGNWQLTAPAGYTGPTTGTGSLTAVSAVTGQYTISYGSLSGYVAPSNQSQFVTGGSTTLFTAVYLQISTNIGTPSGVSATEGTYTNRIRVVWQGVANATGYEIWRSQSNDSATAIRIADIPLVTLRTLKDTAYYYDDYNIDPALAYYYWVRAKTASLISPMSYVGMGYTARTPEETTGTVDLAASDLVFLPVNLIPGSTAGTVSCRLANLGPDALNASGVAFDFHLGRDAASIIWIGSAQDHFTLAAGEEELVILTPTAKRQLAARADMNGTQTVQVTARHLGTLNDPNLANNTTTGPGLVRVKQTGVSSLARALNDYDGDGKADGAVAGFAGDWHLALSGGRYVEYANLAVAFTDWRNAAGDYDGDGVADPGIYDPATGWWYARLSGQPEQLSVLQFGLAGFDPVPADYDGDGKTDPTVYNAEAGYWLGLKSGSGYQPGDVWLGGVGYGSAIGDYDGDNKADPAVYAEATGQWIITLTSRGYQSVAGAFGGLGLQAVAADYDGDGLSDPALYHASSAVWFFLLSNWSSNILQGYVPVWGTYGDAGALCAAADFDGDGLTDPATYLPATGIWKIYLSSQGYQLFTGIYGGPEYQPVQE